MFMEEEGVHECVVCREDNFCPDIKMKTPLDCPVGWLCQGTSLYSHVQLKECPEGFYCPTGTVTYDISLDVLNYYD